MFDRYAKAIIGAAIAALGAWVTAVADGGVTAAEWGSVAMAGLVTLAAVWGYPNVDAPARGVGPSS